MYSSRSKPDGWKLLLLQPSRTKPGIPILLWPSCRAKETFCLTVRVSWSCDQHIAKRHSVLGDETRGAAVPAWGDTALQGGQAQGSGLPAAAFGLNLLLHFSQNLHLQAELQ